MNETIEIEEYLHGAGDPGDRLVTEAKLLLNGEFKDNLFWQKQTYALVQDYGRQQLKAEIQKAETKLFQEKRFTRFRKQIFQIFNSRL
jgi:hypothetical protein